MYRLNAQVYVGFGDPETLQCEKSALLCFKYFWNIWNGGLNFTLPGVHGITATLPKPPLAGI